MSKQVELSDILAKYGVPDPKIVGKLPKGNTMLDFVGHADVTKMLIEIDPNWTWEPVAFDDQGLPAYRVENGYAHMAGWLTIHGIRRLGIGSVQHNKQDLLKELCSDFIRNAAMRFGICLALWTKQEWDDLGDKPAPAAPVAAPKPAAKKVIVSSTPAGEITEEQRRQFIAACNKAGIDPAVVAENAKLEWGPDSVIYEADLPILRESFRELKSFKEGN